MTAHKPATALPWEFDAEPGNLSGWIGQPDTEGREGTVVASPEPHGRMATSERKNATRVRVLDERSKQDAAYIAHAANSYPKLVNALRDCANAIQEECNAGDHDHPIIRDHARRKDKARALLRELGEAE